MAGQDDFSFLFGWHAYCKDTEAHYTTLASSHTLRVEGLSTLPNFSFMHRKALAPGFAFQNSHNDHHTKKQEVTTAAAAAGTAAAAAAAQKEEEGKQRQTPAAAAAAAAKTYLSCVQTDSLGLGAWLSPSRGTIPYAWETPLVSID